MGRERGAGAVEVVGVVLLVVAIVTTVSLSAAPIGRWIGWKAQCVVESADEVWLEGAEIGAAAECGPEPSTEPSADEDDGGDGPENVPPDTGKVPPEDYDELCDTSNGYDADEPCHPRDEGCEYDEDGSVVGEPSDFGTVWTVDGRVVLWTGCQAYTPPPECSAPRSGWEQGEDLSDAEGFAEWVECVTRTTGGDPDEDPDTEDCQDATPGSWGVEPELDPDEPIVQVGCARYWVPKQCKAEWDAYRDWSGPASQEARAAALKDCVERTLNGMERDCMVWQKTEAKNEVHQVLFWEWSKSRAFVFEKMGDGTVRMHALHGSGKGNGISLEVVAGKGKAMGGVSLGAWVAHGASGDTTYEFRNLEDAQEWVDWYVEYEKADQAVADFDATYDCYYGDCSDKDDVGKNMTLPPVQGPMPGQSVPGSSKGYKAGGTWSTLMNELEDQRSREPGHKVIHVAESSSKKTTINVGAWFGGKQGGGGKIPDGKGTKDKYEGGGGVGGNMSLSTETVVEERVLRESGKRVTTFSMNSAVGGQVMLMFIGVPSSKGQPFGTGGGAGEETGSSSISVLWNADGTVEHIQFRTTTTTLERWSAEAGGHVSIGYGPFEIFNAGGYKTWGGAEGTEAVVELTIPVEGLSPEARKMLQASAEGLFPRDEDGNLDRDATLDFGKDWSGTYSGDILDEIGSAGGVRSLEYDVDEEREGSKGGVKIGAIKLWSSEWTEIETEKGLTSSSLQYVDVNGESRTVDPAPKCKAPTKDTSGDDYYDDSGSDPVTSSHPDGQGYYRDRSETPVFGT